uniref:Uncharacterized protein n=1 Tax=uncultured Aminicenantes bacterium TaxID=174294 RepID=Q2YZY7_9BACT|nr:hypothetical protein [uncultured Aminicenantes bacterium]
MDSGPVPVSSKNEPSAGFDRLIIEEKTIRSLDTMEPAIRPGVQ